VQASNPSGDAPGVPAGGSVANCCQVGSGPATRHGIADGEMIDGCDGATDQLTKGGGCCERRGGRSWWGAGVVGFHHGIA